ncbi:MAG: uracil-DNA glycosylase family protein [Hyphomicrobium sp.]
MSSTTHEALRALLEWTIEMGADEVIDDEAHNWFDQEKFPSQSSRLFLDESSKEVLSESLGNKVDVDLKHSKTENLKGSLQKASSITQPLASSLVSLETILENTRVNLKTVKNLEELKTALENFEGCSLKKTAKTLCFYRGTSNASLMIIGEAPGRDEDLKGSPFVGRAGQLLDRMLAAIGLDEKSVHITNVVYWRPPGNRTPTPQETEVCRPFLEKQISLVSPSILLLLGSSAAKQILRSDEGILRIRGRWFETNIRDALIPTLASLHPAYLLRTPAAKKFAWRDFLMVKKALLKDKA